MARRKRSDLAAIGLLLADHRRLRTLFRAFAAADRADHAVLFAKMRAASLELHALAARLRSQAESLLAPDEAPGQIEPSADAAGAFEPALDEALARRLAR
jgi:hypothetical protein